MGWSCPQVGGVMRGRDTARVHLTLASGSPNCKRRLGSNIPGAFRVWAPAQPADGQKACELRACSESIVHTEASGDPLPPAGLASSAQGKELERGSAQSGEEGQRGGEKLSLPCPLTLEGLPAHAPSELPAKALGISSV